MLLPEMEAELYRGLAAASGCVQKHPEDRVAFAAAAAAARACVDDVYILFLLWALCGNMSVHENTTGAHASKRVICLGDYFVFAYIN